LFFVFWNLVLPHFFLVRLTIVNYLKAEGNLRPMRDMVTYCHLKTKARKERANETACADAHKWTEAYQQELQLQGSNVSAEMASDLGAFDTEM